MPGLSPAQPGKRRGRKAGARMVLSLRGLLERMPIGAHVWTEQNSQQAGSTAGRCVPPIRVETETFYAVHPGTRTLVVLTRVTVLERATTTTTIDAGTEPAEE